MPLRSILKMRFCYPVRVHKRKICFSCFKNYLNENCFFFSIPSWSQQYYQIHNMKGHLAFTPFLLAESYLRCFWMNARSEGHRFQWMLGQVPKFCFAKFRFFEIISTWTVLKTLQWGVRNTTEKKPVQTLRHLLLDHRLGSKAGAPALWKLWSSPGRFGFYM